VQATYATLGLRWMHCVYVPDRRGDEVTGFVALLQDVTKRKEAEEAQARLAAIVTSSSDAIVSKTFEGIITTWNMGAQLMFGYTPEEMIGESILRLVPDELHDEEGRILARLRNGERIDHYETVRMTKDGRHLDVSLTISPIRDAAGKLIGASKIAHDITERRAAEERLRVAKEQAEAASRAKDHFLAALSHELRTPLTPVLMAAATLREDSRLPEDVREDLGMIERNVALEARLIDDLLDLTRISRGKLSLRTEPCDVHSLIGLVVDIVREEAREKGIDLDLDFCARHSTITGDPTRLQQVFWNVLRNAVKFTPAGGHVRIHSHDGPYGNGNDGGTRICITITDDGIGLDAAAAERIFEPFEQAAPGPEHRFGGLGLGLAIARAIVDLHQGTIRAESPGTGQGSTFTLEFPATSASASAMSCAYPREPGPGGEAPSEPPLRLLLVEDHASTLQVLTRLLTRVGHRVTGVSSIAAARAAAATQSFDAVVSDLGLPDGTGITLVEELRANHGLRGIVLSGYGMEDDLRRSLEAGCVAHLVKPVDINELRRILRQFASGG
jgi:PAS domain S-box-containing protein